MAGNTPEERVRWPLAHQRWRSIAFLHWRYDPGVVARLLPSGLSVDVVDGSAWVALTPFAVEAFRPPLLPPLPVLSQYPETNLRTYVRDERGADGLWFFSLDVESLPTVAVARALLAVRYYPARMRVEDGATVRYESRRLVGPAAHHRVTVRPGDRIDVSERDARLIGRWRAFTRHLGRVWVVPVDHAPWPVHAATVEELDQSITAAAGLPDPEGEPLVHWSPGVSARLGPPRLS